MDTDTRNRIKFFAEHAGYCSPPGRMACARDLARAELALEELMESGRARIEWEYDEFNYDLPEHELDGIERGRFEEPYGCVLRLDGDVEMSLWGIVLNARGSGRYGTWSQPHRSRVRSSLHVGRRRVHRRSLCRWPQLRCHQRLGLHQR